MKILRETKGGEIDRFEKRERWRKRKRQGYRERDEERGENIKT